ncbi:MAG: hypothetical protein NTZ17_12190 [Phycisphaerae bacterium]|nr:hypothetical protein [Phycisphaerae bacterium]
MRDGKLRGTPKGFKAQSDCILTLSVEREADRMEIRLIGQPQWDVLNQNPMSLQCPTEDVSEDHAKVRSAVLEIWQTVPAISHKLDFSFNELSESLNILALPGRELYEKYLGAYEAPASSEIANLVEVLITKDRPKPPVFIMMSQSDSCVLPLSFFFRRRATESEPKKLRSDAGEQEILAFARRFVGFSAVVCRQRSQHYLGRAEDAKSAFSKLRPQVKLLPNTDLELGPFLMDERQTFSRLQQRAYLSRVLELPCPVTCAEEIVDFLETQDEPAAEIHHWFCRGELSVPKNGTSGREKARLLICNNCEVSIDDFRMNGDHYRLPRYDFPAFHFINACNSASLHGEFSAGWLSFWLQKGWLGIIGAEYKVPPLFAVQFSRVFYNKFVKQKLSAGESFYRTCEYFLLKHHSPLGLLYSLYVPYDLRLQ